MTTYPGPNISPASMRLYACIEDPCDECRGVTPRRAYPAPPHGDLRRRVDIVLVGLNPQLADYRVRCGGCTRIGLVRDYLNGKDSPLRCRACDHLFSIDEADFVRPTLEEWTAEGLALDAKGRSWINVRFDLDALPPSTNVLNTRMCWWPSYDDQTISTGELSGGHLLDLINEVKPRVVVAYNQKAADVVRCGTSPAGVEHSQQFLTSGKKGRGQKRHIARWIEATDTSYGLIISSQARDAPSATDANGVTMRTWSATLAQTWITG